MNISDTVVALREQVRAASQEFDFAIACHEAWKPAAYDTALHHRLSHSYAGNTFLVVRSVLRREMLMALTRLWGEDDKRALGMRFVAKCLSRPAIIQQLADECSAQWGRIHDPDVGEIPEEGEREGLVEAMNRSEVAFGLGMAETL